MSSPNQPRAAIYVRVSTTSQEVDGTSLVSQEDYCRKFAAEQGYQVGDEHIYREVHTGSELWERRKLTRLRESIARGEIEALIVYAVDRLSRKQAHIAIIADECERSGVSLLFVTEEFERSAVGEFIRGAKAFAAELEREKIKERTQRGLRSRIESGKLRGGGYPMFGYRWRDEQHSAYEIEPANAALVRRMFALAALGRSTRAIAMALDAEGVPTPRGKANWSHTSVQGILRNEQYTGEARAYRIEARKINGKETRRKRAFDEQVALPAGTIPPLIDAATFTAAQERLDRNKAEAPRNHTEPERFLLRSGFITCGYCGHALTTRLARSQTGPRYAFYRVNGGNGHVSCGHYFGISAALLDRAVWSRVTDLLTQPELVAAEAAKRRTVDTSAPRLAEVQAALAATVRQQSNITRAVAQIDDDETTAPLVAELKTLAARKRDLDKEHATLRREQEQWQATQDQLDGLATWVRTVATNLDQLSYEERRLALTALGVKVRVWEQGHEPRYEIVAHLPLNPRAETFEDSHPRYAVHNTLTLRWTDRD